MTLRLVVAFFLTVLTLLPAQAWAPFNEKQAKVRVGSVINRKVLECIKKEDLISLIIGTATPKQVTRLFKSPYPCSVWVIRAKLLELHGRFKDIHGEWFWVIGVGSEEDTIVQFYIAYPADEITIAP